MVCWGKNNNNYYDKENNWGGRTINIQNISIITKQNEKTIQNDE